ncbi:MAG TPA: DUF2818 domain-containing protein [Pusillimonas sp.]|jgi:hypothetical protein|nr:hypothetical protein [Pusillimonas sp.]MBC40866.1 hypothetical protein [Pusillimonas sp.]HBT33141.1 DUF2818 domain-containing protein [Pusillimonas sp.]HCN73264.1 DUF2818 domain-containing protein [Pusillimonas sp.]HCP77237.1 DUF2818 domain-containing protein [Pusillimonas sp.]
MDITLAIVLLVGLSLVTANLPFLVERSYLVVPWSAPGGRFPGGPLRWLESLLFFAVLVVLGWITWRWIGQSIAGPFGLVLRVVVMGLLFGAVLAYPGVRAHKTGFKPFLLRMCEVFVFYCLIGLLAFAFEASMGNVFQQTWEFYVITLSLFLVMAYPGYVYRYLLRRR